MRRLNCLIVGFGNLGFRYLEGVSKNSNVHIMINDINPDAYNKLNGFDAGKNNKVSILKNIVSSSTFYDIAIIATNSDTRFTMTKKLLESNRIGYLILEKIVFDKYNDYDEFNYILDNKYPNVKCYVCLPRRLSQLYLDLRELLTNETGYFDIVVSGGNWGLASNTIHFIDLLNFLIPTNTELYTMSSNILEIIESKRSGFIDFIGSIIITSKSFKLQLESDYLNRDLELSINTSNHLIHVNETIGELTIFSKVSNFKKSKRFESTVRFHSEFLNQIIDEVRLGENLSLTLYKEIHSQSKELVRLFLDIQNLPIDYKVKVT